MNGDDTPNAPYRSAYSSTKRSHARAGEEVTSVDEHDAGV
jgi:hypothetical protein